MAPYAFVIMKQESEKERQTIQTNCMDLRKDTNKGEGFFLFIFMNDDYVPG